MCWIGDFAVAEGVAIGVGGLQGDGFGGAFVGVGVDGAGNWSIIDSSDVDADGGGW